jgi:DNA recombination protein RmuC
MILLSLLIAFLGWALFVYKEVSLKKLEKELSDLKIEKKGLEIKNEALNAMGDTFKLLSQEVLEKNTNQFIKTADDKQSLLLSTLTPLKESLSKLTTGLENLEKERKGDHEGLKTQLRLLKDSEVLLKEQTQALVSALKNPVSRGMWGEMQLKRVLEISGMLPYCDFVEQQVLNEGKLRPDVIVKLSGGRHLVIDAKAPLEAFLEASETQDETSRLIKLKEHAAHLKDHVTSLSKKAYFEHLPNSIELVVLFLPQESLFSAALSAEPSLIELASKNQVIIATPTTLLGLLKAVAFGWKQETLSQEVEAVKLLGKELYKRIFDLGSHFSKLGKNLNQAVESYNKALGTLESRVLVSARKFNDLGIETLDAKEPELEAITLISKEPTIS